jgi:hypothetical protein
MKYLIISFVALLFQVTKLNATTFLPLSIERQVAESELVVESTFLGKEYKKINGIVVTEFVFNVKRFSGNGDSVTDWSKLKVLTPGGVWQGIVYNTFGTPRFDENETYVLLLKKNEVGLAFLNLSLGKYNLQTVEGKRYLSSSVFSEHPTLGKIDETKFEKVLKERFQEGFKVVYVKSTDPKFVIQNSKNSSTHRKPASYNKDPNEDHNAENTLSVFWLIIILAMLGSFVSLKFRN